MYKPQTDEHMDDQREIIIHSHYQMAGYKNTKFSNNML